MVTLSSRNISEKSSPAVRRRRTTPGRQGLVRLYILRDPTMQAQARLTFSLLQDIKITTIVEQDHGSYRGPMAAKTRKDDDTSSWDSDFGDSDFGCPNISLDLTIPHLEFDEFHV